MSRTLQQSEWLQRYEQQGYVALPGFLGGDELGELLGNLQRFIHETVPKLPREQVFYEDRNEPATLKQIQHLENHDPWFHRLLSGGRFRKLAELLLGGEVAAKNMQYFNKPPGIGKPTPAHQDGYYFMLDPCEALTMWLALDEVDEENGCVRYVPGSNKQGLREHTRTTTLGFSQGIVGFSDTADRQREIAMPASPGDLLVHDAMTIHRADGNRSASRSRRALGLIYFSSRAREDVDAQAAYQKKLAEQMKAVGRI